MAETEEFSRPLALAESSAEGTTIKLSAGPAERAALARRFRLLDLAVLEAVLRVRMNLGGEIEVAGRLTADITQTCVVTLEAFPTRVEERFQLRFMRADAEGDAEQAWGGDAELPPESLVGETLDLGEVLAQQFGLSIDPFPRRAGARIDPELLGAAPQKPAEGPFSGLAALKNKFSA